MCVRLNQNSATQMYDLPFTAELNKIELYLDDDAEYAPLVRLLDFLRAIKTLMSLFILAWLC